MLSDFNPIPELLTPIIFSDDGVSKFYPVLPTSTLFPHEETDVAYSSTSSKKPVHHLTTVDSSIETNENNTNQQQQQDDLYSTFELPVLTDLCSFQLEKYTTESSCTSPLPDMEQSVILDDELMFYPIDDSSSPWVAGECTVESSKIDDMTVPPSCISSPMSESLSSSLSSSSVVEKRSARKRNYSAVERKLRKKDQNKTAAEKYRQKKRTERTELLTRHATLKNQNQELKFELENVTFRLEQFKQLFVDVLQLPVSHTK